MKISRKFLISTIIAGTAIGGQAAPVLEFDGGGKIRGEKHRNTNDLNGSGGKNAKSFTLSQVDLAFKVKRSESANWEIYVQPKFSKLAGNSTGTSGTNTDGGTYLVHQAYLTYNLMDNFSLQAGRQELDYGDGLIIGNNEWDERGRAFDGAVLSSKLFGGKLDAFYTKINDNTTVFGNGGDYNFYGLYYMTSIGEMIKELDFYTMVDSDRSDLDKPNDLYIVGARMKANFAGVKLRAEVTGQKGKAGTGTSRGSVSGQQYDAEIGYGLPFFGTSLSVGYFRATKNYNQLYATTDDLLGKAEMFSRKNIKGYSFNLAVQPLDVIYAKISYFMFSRVSADAAVQVDGGLYTNAGADKEKLANELDIVLGLEISEGLNLEGGFSLIKPGEYFEANNAKADGTLSYLQLSADF